MSKDNHRRIGRFEVRHSAVNDHALLEHIFTGLRFVPYRVEYLYAADGFDCLGTSPKFDVVPEGLEAPLYSVTVTTLEGEYGPVEVKREYSDWPYRCRLEKKGRSVYDPDRWEQVIARGLRLQ